MEKLINSPFLYYLKKYKNFFGVGCAALVITDVSDILAPYIMGVLLNRFQSQQNLDNTTYLFGALILASFTTAGFRYAWRVYFAKFHHSVALDLRLQCYKSYFKQDLITFEDKSTGDKMSIFTKDIENFRMGIGPGLLILLDALLYLILIPIAMWQLNPKWTLTLVFIAPIIPVVIALMEKKLNTLFNKRQAELSELSSLAQESLEGIKVIKSFRMEKFRESLYDQENKKLFKTSTNLDFLHSSFSPVLEFFISTSCAALLFSVAYYSDLDSLKIGNLFAFYQYMQRMTWPLTALGLSYMMISEAKSSFKRIAPVIDSQNHQSEPAPSEIHLSKAQNLNFSYPGESLFVKNLSIQLEKGKSYLIAGKTKSGKTSLFNILNGLLETDAKIEKELHSVSNPQIPFLFMDTVDKNISLSNEKIHKEDLKSVAFEDEYLNLPYTGGTRVGEKGTSLSGGQKQRLSLLRALKSNAKLLFLDEPMSAVDEKTKSQLIQTLKEQKDAGVDLVIATSNPEHYTWMDQVILIKDTPESQERTIRTMGMSAALKEQDFKKLLRKDTESKTEVKNER